MSAVEMIASVRFSQLDKKVAPSPLGKKGACAVTIGNFDGCHLGHQALIEQTLALKQRSVALTFHPRPEAFFRGLENDALLFTPEQKLRAFAELGLDGVCVQTFDLDFSKLTHQTFYTDVLRGYLHAQSVVVGDNFHFGHRREGNPAWLQATMAQEGLCAYIVPPVSYGDQPVSSTRIRASLLRGDIAAVSAMLGRPYLLEGFVGRGAQLGRTLEVPTLNLVGYSQLVPAEGVYAGYVWLKGLCLGEDPTVTALPKGLLPAAVSVSRRPTFAELGSSLSVEAHVLSDSGLRQAGEVYGRKLGIYFTHFLRADKKFPNPGELVTQIQSDITLANQLLQG